MPLKPELADFIRRARDILSRLYVDIGGASADLDALSRLSDLATDETARALVGKARAAVQAATDSFDATDFKTADISEVVVEIPIP